MRRGFCFIWILCWREIEEHREAEGRQGQLMLQKSVKCYLKYTDVHLLYILAMGFTNLILMALRSCGIRLYVI